MNQSSGTLQRRTDISLTTALMSIQADPFQHIGVSAAGRPAANRHRLFVGGGRAPDLSPLPLRRISPWGSIARVQCFSCVAVAANAVRPRPLPNDRAEYLQTEREKKESQVTNFKKSRGG